MVAIEYADSTVFRFADLPRELRDEIYDFVFEMDMHTNVDLFKPKSAAPPWALIAVSRSLRDEAQAKSRTALREFWSTRVFEIFMGKEILDLSTQRDLAMRCHGLSSAGIRKLPLRIGGFLAPMPDVVVLATLKSQNNVQSVVWRRTDDPAGLKEEIAMTLGADFFARLMAVACCNELLPGTLPSLNIGCCVMIFCESLRMPPGSNVLKQWWSS
ncbi:hypothetical protein LTR78_007305 [Recurvomyces mirabilis]|uniref:Uncharacterized protein n=1 Tax=Recurvomyces mirabilis TaxID=574656 RepID=A0AAE0TVG0_9PEZI|nr:hypothetical protein LTR78_007305 [Recurvomyces mirabilis]KAK5155106.1 hypothetical protein LTS14_006061 [Recurvomyces mirabilis]